MNKIAKNTRFVRVEDNAVFVYPAKVKQISTWKESEAYFVMVGNRFAGTWIT